ncbi:hypothetical protein AJ90_17795 [Vibrio parahaemolyticus M0605]|nr:hypothetical protein AJ90_17795 [Vibrio parahaemolyticus M0605]
MKLDMDSGNTAEQADSQENEKVTSSLAEKLKAAYIEERSNLKSRKSN